MTIRFTICATALGLTFASRVPSPRVSAQAASKPAAAQKLDEEYTKLIKQNL